MSFMIVRSLSPYNGIIGRPRIRVIQAVLSTVHGMLKFQVEGGIVTIRSTVLIPTECTSMITSSAVSREERTRPANFKVALHPDFPDQEVAIRGALSDKGRTELCSILKKNLDIFSWQPSDMTGVPQSVAEHWLNIREGYSPVRQKKKGQALERTKAIQAEVQKLVEAGIMREVYYHDWLSNPVMVKKHDGSWRMCVDFTDLNKACPHDCYPLPEIDWKVESLCGYPFKCFLDAYKGYHQIQLAEPDKEKTAFHTGQGVYCYTKMPFGLKNAGATYQRLMDKSFESQIGRNIKVYVDDLVIKSYTEAEMMRDIEETFRILRKVNMKLNPKKCSFGLAEGIFFGYVVTPEGIKPCLDKTAAVLQLPSPRTIKEAHPITVITDQPIKQVLYRLDVARWLQKWSIMLGEHNITYRPRTSVKGQILADFLIEMRGKKPQAAPAADTQQEPWTLFTDGSSSSNNEAKYEALIAGLRIAARMGVKDIHVSVDSKLVANQVLGTYVAKEDNMVKRSFLTSWLRCVGPLQAEYVMREIHEGSCSMHVGPRSVVAKAIRLGYYWPTMHRDAHDMILKCNDWNRHSWPFSEGLRKVKFLIVAMDYFTKWIEVKAVATITGGQVKKFVWDNIVCRFGILVIPIKIGMPTYRTAAVDVVSNDKELQLNMDLLEERRERAAIYEANAKSKKTKYYNARVRGVTFKPGDFVYRSNDASHAVAGGKLGPKWEGRYEVTKALGDRAYKLRSMDRIIFPRTWNIANLK
nr:reverse transcriptase domain-containing protein [Tanacetum cinerariifolium]